MPIPKPKKGEPRTKFMGRCLSDPAMKKKHKDIKQRFAICAKSWREKK